MGKRLSVKYQGKILSELTTEIPSNGIITVGNEASATIELKGENIAPEQFVVVCEPEQIILMCRVDGMIINNTPVSQGAIHNLQVGDAIEIGDYSFYLENEEASDENVSDSSTTFSETVKSDSEEIHESKSDRTLTDVLKSLRSEEKFYFQIESADGEVQRLFLENDESYLGKTENENFVLTSDENEIETTIGQIRKDWGGVVFLPFQTNKIWFENKPLTETHRLKNDDRLYLTSLDTQKPDLKTVIKFHEPTALLVLDSILPKELPPPISLDEKDSLTAGTPEDTPDLHISQIPSKSQTLPKLLYFGYFTITEIIIMIIGTLITAVIIFLILELY